MAVPRARLADVGKSVRNAIADCCRRSSDGPRAVGRIMICRLMAAISAACSESSDRGRIRLPFGIVRLRGSPARPRRDPWRSAVVSVSVQQPVIPEVHQVRPMERRQRHVFQIEPQELALRIESADRSRSSVTGVPPSSCTTRPCARGVTVCSARNMFWKSAASYDSFGVAGAGERWIVDRTRWCTVVRCRPLRTGVEWIAVVGGSTWYRRRRHEVCARACSHQAVAISGLK